MMRSSLRFGSDSTFASDSSEVNQILGSSGSRRRSPRAICSARPRTSSWLAMPTLIFSAIVPFLQDALDLIKEIANQLLGRLEPIGPPLVGFVAVPVIEGGRPLDKPGAAMRHTVRVVVAH